MIPDRYVWLTWSAAFLLPWAALYLAYPRHRRIMLRTSLVTAPFGLTEPLFVPEYWSPPSVFDLALRTGFDLESLIFCFGIGGVGAVLVNVLTGHGVQPVEREERLGHRHRFHRWILALPFLVFVALLPAGWNPIYPGIVAMLAGGALAAWCRPDLTRSTALGAAVFLVYYAVFLTGLEVTSPGYVEAVWNLDALSGVRLAFMPVEELLFALAFGAYWAGVYEHITWGRAAPLPRSETPSHAAAGG
jgi:hypothetical protein